MPQTEPPKARRERALIVLALLAAAGAMTAFYLSSSRSAEPLLRAGPAPRALGEGMVVGARPRTSSLFPVGGRRLTLKGLLTLLRERGSPEAARRVLAAIEDNPVLKQAYDKFVAERGEDAPLDDFLDRVRRTPEYQAEEEKLRADPAVHDALARVAQETGVAAFVGGAGLSAAEGRLYSSSLARPALAVAPLTGFIPLREARRSAKAGAPAGNGQSFFGGSIPVFTESAAPRRTDSQAPPLIEEAKGGGHGVEKLSLVKAAGPGADVAQFLSSTFSEMPKDKRDILLRTCEVDDVCEAAPACVKANLVADCEAACKASPKCGRDFPIALERAVERAATETAAAGGGGGATAGAGGPPAPTLSSAPTPPPAPAERTYNGLPLSAWAGLPFMTREEVEYRGMIVGDSDGQIFTPQEFGVRTSAILIGSPLARALGDTRSPPPPSENGGNTNESVGDGDGW